MARKRFNTAEKEIIAEALPIEWQNVTQWHAGILSGCIEQDDSGWQFVTVTNLANTRTVSKGQTIHVSPGHLRRAQNL